MNKKQFKEIRKPRVFKTVIKGFDGKTQKVIINVLYQNREETYIRQRADSYKDIDVEDYSQDTAVEMCRNSGAKEIHYTTEEEKDQAWKEILKED